MDFGTDQRKVGPKTWATGDGFGCGWHESVSEQCQYNPYGFNGVGVIGDETYGMTPGCIPDMTGYNQYQCGNGFIAGVIHADHWNNANVAVTVSAISAPMNTRNQQGGHHLDPPSTDGYGFQPVYGWGGNGSQLWDRDEQPKEEEKNLGLKEKKKKAGRRKRKRSRHAGH